jgi:hypothetical protein
MIKLRAIALWEETGALWGDKGDRALRRKGRSRFGKKRAIALPDCLTSATYTLPASLPQ